MKTVPAGEFKAKCLSLLDEVARKKVGIVVTKHGKSVAQVVPCPESNRESVNPLKDSLVFLIRKQVKVIASSQFRFGVSGALGIRRVGQDKVELWVKVSQMRAGVFHHDLKEVSLGLQRAGQRLGAIALLFDLRQ